jgi:hypothetical protein
VEYRWSESILAERQNLILYMSCPLGFIAGR